MQRTYLISTLFLTVLFFNVTQVNGMESVTHCVSHYISSGTEENPVDYDQVKNSIKKIPSQGKHVMISYFMDGKFQMNSILELENHNQEYVFKIDQKHVLHATRYEIQWWDRPAVYGLIGALISAGSIYGYKKCS